MNNAGQLIEIGQRLQCFFERPQRLILMTGKAALTGPAGLLQNHPERGSPCRGQLPIGLCMTMLEQCLQILIEPGDRQCFFARQHLVHEMLKTLRGQRQRQPLAHQRIELCAGIGFGKSCRPVRVMQQGRNIRLRHGLSLHAETQQTDGRSNNRLAIERHAQRKIVTAQALRQQRCHILRMQRFIEQCRQFLAQRAQFRHNNGEPCCRVTRQLLLHPGDCDTAFGILIIERNATGLTGRLMRQRMLLDNTALRSQGIEQALLQGADAIESGQRDTRRRRCKSALQTLQLPTEIAHRLKPAALLAEILKLLPPEQKLAGLLRHVIAVQAQVPLDQQAVGLLCCRRQAGLVEQRLGIKVFQTALYRLLPQQPLLGIAEPAARHLLRRDTAAQKSFLHLLVQPVTQRKRGQRLPLLLFGSQLAGVKIAQTARKAGGGAEDEGWRVIHWIILLVKSNKPQRTPRAQRKPSKYKLECLIYAVGWRDALVIYAKSIIHVFTL